MRVRFAWMVAISILVLLISGCNDGDDDTYYYSGSDTFIESMQLGNVPITAGGTFNVPMSYITSMRFELSRPVTRASLAELFEFQFFLENLDTDDTYMITELNIDENGELYWIDEDTIEFRMFHPMDTIVSGGVSYILGSPGNTFRFTLQHLVGQAKDGTQFAFSDDEFYIVWTNSNQG